MKTLAWITLFFLSANSFAELTIRSSLEDVSLFYYPHTNSEKSVKKFLGKLPLKIKKRQGKNRNLLRLEVYKRGYMPKEILIADQIDHTREINVELDELKLSEHFHNNDLSFLAAEQIIDDIVVIQNLLAQKKLTDADVMIKKLEKDYQDSISVRVLRANHTFLKGELSQSKILYSKILSDIPKDRGELKKMVEQMMKSLNFLSYGGKR